jgi:hypothetical protein
MFSPISPTPPRGTIERTVPSRLAGAEGRGLSVTGGLLLDTNAACGYNGRYAYYILFIENRQPGCAASGGNRSTILFVAERGKYEILGAGSISVKSAPK